MFYSQGTINGVSMYEKFIASFYPLSFGHRVVYHSLVSPISSYTTHKPVINGWVFYDSILRTAINILKSKFRLNCEIPTI